MSTPFDHLTDEELVEPRLGLSEVALTLGLSPMSVRRKIKAGVFPQPERLSTNDKLTWRRSVVGKWLRENLVVGMGAQDENLAKGREKRNASRTAA